MESRLYKLYEYNKLNYYLLNNISIIILNIPSSNNNIDKFLTQVNKKNVLSLFTKEPDIINFTEN